MDMRQDSSNDTEGKDQEGDLRTCVGEIFDRCPGLVGFSVTERLVSSDPGVREWELYVSDIAVSCGYSPDPSEQFRHDISGMLSGFLDARPEAAVLLSGRTFARTWH